LLCSSMFGVLLLSAQAVFGVSAHDRARFFLPIGVC
jgi:hypothetical protein